jgi:hypothetical protein
MLLEYSGRYGLRFWQSWAHLHERAVAAHDAVNEPTLTTVQMDVIATLREDFVPSGALARVDSDQAVWSAAEILRVAGESIRRSGGEGSMEAAEASFLRSLALARRQNALSWELRTATSLARLWKDQHRVGAARELLAAVRNRFAEGFQTRDCSRADALLKELRASTQGLSPFD